MNSTNKITAYILCGGKSERMKTEKGLLIYQNKTFVECIINAIKPIANSIFLVTKNENYEAFGYPLVADVFENKGPVGGIYTALNHSSTKKNLIISCDVPRIKAEIFSKYLIPNCKNSDLIFLSDGKNDYPLIGVYSKKSIKNFESAIKKNHLKLLKLIETLDYKRIQVNVEDQWALLNINTQADLEKL